MKKRKAGHASDLSPGLCIPSIVRQCAGEAVVGTFAASRDSRGVSEALWHNSTSESGLFAAPDAGEHCERAKSDASGSDSSGDGNGLAGGGPVAGISLLQWALSAPDGSRIPTRYAEPSPQETRTHKAKGSGQGSKGGKGGKGRSNGSRARGRNALVRRRTVNGGNFESSTRPQYQDTGADTSDKAKVLKRLGDAAVNFWPYLSKETRLERVHDTMLEVLSREERGETHKISWWAKWMFVRTHDRAKRNEREIPVEDMAEYLPIARGGQIEYAAACQAGRLVKFLPPLHREVMTLLIDGANPLEISNEAQVPIVKVLDLIRDARLWLSDGGCYLANTKDCNIDGRGGQHPAGSHSPNST